MMLRLLSRATRLSARAVKPSVTSKRCLAFPMVRSFCTEEAGEPEKYKGTTKWFDSKKGFGFISPDDGSADVFVHQTQIHAPGFRNLAEGEPVEFATETSEDGRVRATQVTGPEGSYVQGAPRPAPVGRDDDWSF